MRNLFYLQKHKAVSHTVSYNKCTIISYSIILNIIDNLTKSNTIYPLSFNKNEYFRSTILTTLQKILITQNGKSNFH